MTNSTGVNESVTSDNDEDSNPLETVFIAVFTKLRSSILWFTIAMGVVVAVLGATPLFNGYVAGLMGISGVSLVLFGLIGIGALRLIGYSG